MPKKRHRATSSHSNLFIFSSVTTGLILIAAILLALRSQILSTASNPVEGNNKLQSDELDYSSWKVKEALSTRSRSVAKLRERSIAHTKHQTLSSLLDEVYQQVFSLLHYETINEDLKSLNIFAKRVSRLILKLKINENILRSVLLNPMFRIQIAKEDSLLKKMEAESGITISEDITYGGFYTSYESYNKVERVIVVIFNPHYTDKKLIDVLQNEFHHAAIEQTNKFIGGKSNFLNENQYLKNCYNSDLKIDLTLQPQVIKAMHADYKNLASFLTAFSYKRENKQLTKEQLKQIKLFMLAVADHKPAERGPVWQEPTDVIEKKGSRLSFMRYTEPVFGKALKIKYNGYINRKSIEYDSDSNMMFFRFSANKDDSLHERSWAQLLWIHQQFAWAAYDNYAQGGDTKLSQEQNAEEIMSFVMEHPPAVRALIFPNLCDYYSQYLETPSYCI